MLDVSVEMTSFWVAMGHALLGAVPLVFRISFFCGFLVSIVGDLILTVIVFEDELEEDDELEWDDEL